MSQDRERFQERVEELVAQFEREVDSNEWVTRRYQKRMRDDDRTVYEVPALYLQKGPVKLLLDPTGYHVVGAEAGADLYLMPTYDPTVFFFHENGQWTLYFAPSLESIEMPPVDTAEGLPLTKATINQALNSIADHAVPSV